MPSGELRIKHVMTNLLCAVARIRILGSNMHVWNLQVRNPRLCRLYAITCSGGQLKRGLRVVLRPILQGALHIRSIIQQQLWRGWREVEGGGEGGGREQTGRESRVEENRRGGDGVLLSGLARGKSLNCWKPKPPHLALDTKHTPCYTSSLGPVWGGYCWCSLA